MKNEALEWKKSELCHIAWIIGYIKWKFCNLKYFETSLKYQRKISLIKFIGHSMYEMFNTCKLYVYAEINIVIYFSFLINN